MDMNKILQWMELAKKYQSSNFWSEIFDQFPFDDFLKNQMNFGETDSVGSPLNFRNGKKFPLIDIYLTDEEVLVIVDLPGYRKEEIQLSVSGTKLLIKGNNHRAMPGEPLQQERYHGAFERIIELPEPTYPNLIHAKFHNGLLFISYKLQFKREEHIPID